MITLFTKSSSGSLVLLTVYVDDILLAGDDLTEIKSLKSFLDDQFKIKDLGSVHYFLGLEISKTPPPPSQGYIMSQHKYTNDLLAEFNCNYFSSVVTPLDPFVTLTLDMGDLLPDPSLYRSLIGKFNFLQHTRPNISFSVQHLSQFFQKPHVPHMMVGLHVLRYLLARPSQGVLLSNSSDLYLVAYSDSDWDSGGISRKSITGFYVTLGGSSISWKSKKQPTISLSSAEAEYRALRKVAAEISWLVRLLGDLGFTICTHVPVHCDS
ncbi:PREDICTED: uncharacterized protein LOC109210598 [Nicotiana attenuata]|uniref:uncharacterized protein LOC109210598 n=1 Tax=Nicotiana attenuata TaxID=49451 RepID=UPI000904B8D3|nr:PREDICTED: uncharacterized protein LOC109210598 [Nicotiana attenuata]